MKKITSLPKRTLGLLAALSGVIIIAATAFAFPTFRTNFTAVIDSVNESLTSSSDEASLTAAYVPRTRKFNFSNIKRIGGANVDSAIAITSDSNGNVYYVGNFRDEVDFDYTTYPDDPQDIQCSRDLHDDFFLTKMDNAADIEGGIYGYTYAWGSDTYSEEPGGSDGSSNGSDGGSDGSSNGSDGAPSSFLINEAHAADSDSASSSVGEPNEGCPSRESGWFWQDLVEDVAVDSNDNIFLVGSFSGSIDFDPTEGEDIKTAVGDHSNFLIKINADGSYGYSKILTSETNINRFDQDLIIPEYDWPIWSGSFRGTMDFDPSGSEDLRTCDAQSCGYVTWYDDSGNYDGTWVFGGETPGGMEIFDIEVDSPDGTYIVGKFSGQFDFDPFGGSDIISSRNMNDGFITYIQPNQVYGYTLTLRSLGQASIDNVALDLNDNVYYSATFQYPTDINVTSGVEEYSARGTDALVGKLVTDGNNEPALGYNYLISNAGYDSVESLIIDPVDNGAIFYYGRFQQNYGSNKIDFDPTGTQYYVEEAEGSYITRINWDHSYGSTKIISGQSMYATEPQSLTVDSEGNIHGLSNYADTISAGGYAYGMVGAAKDIFVVKYTGYDPPNIPPDGTVMRYEGYPTKYYIQDGEKHAFTASETYSTWAGLQSEHVFATDIFDYIPSGAQMGFRQGSLVKTADNPTVYLIGDEFRYAINSSETFYGLGFRSNTVITVAQRELDLHPSGPAIASTETYPNFISVKGSGPTVYYLFEGKKYAFTSPVVYLTWATWSDIHNISDEDLAAIPSGEITMGFRDGTLIKTDKINTVYVIVNFFRRAFVTRDDFIQLGYDWGDIQIVQPQDLEVNPPGVSPIGGIEFKPGFIRRP